MLDAFRLGRERVIRYQWQRWVKYCLSYASANQFEPGIVLLNKTWDKNGQRAPVGYRLEENERAWDAVVQSGSAIGWFCRPGVQERTTEGEK